MSAFTSFIAFWSTVTLVILTGLDLVNCSTITHKMDSLKAQKGHNIRTEMIKEKSSEILLAYLDNNLMVINESLTQLVSDGHHHQVISPSCLNDIKYLLDSASKRHPWAIKMFDSFGKPVMEFADVSLSFIGHYSECIEISSPTNLYSGQYCLANVKLPIVAIETLKKLSGYSLSTLMKTQPKLGLCVPSNCRPEETSFLTQAVLSAFIPNATVTISQCHQRKPVSLDNELGAIILLIIAALVAALFIVGTLYDYMLSVINSKHDSNENLWTLGEPMRSSRTGQDGRIERRWYEELLLAFSITRNASEILNTETKSGTITSLHGMRFLSMLWIITAHSYSFAMQWMFFRNPQKMQSGPTNVVSQMFANGTFCVDTFFFLSGLLVSLLTFRSLKKRTGKFNYTAYSLHRYLRMTPLMLAIIGFSTTMLKHLGQGPNWDDSIVMYDKWCQNNWWLNALYLHNFINRENMCLSHSWYSAVDMQLYLIAPLVILPLYKKPKLGFLISGLLFVISALITGYLTVAQHLPAVPIFNDNISQSSLDNYYGSIYVKPYCRIGPYLVGILLGYLIHSNGSRLKLKTKYNIIGWLLTLILLTAILLAMWPANNGDMPSDLVSALYSSSSRTLWAIGLSWMTYSCLAGQGGIINQLLSWKALIPLSKLTYSAYLIHPILMATFYGSRESTFEYSNYLMTYLIIGNLVITYVISFALSIFIEAPFVTIGRLIFRAS